MLTVHFIDKSATWFIIFSRKGVRKLIKTWLIVLGVVFLVIGLLGFINNPILALFAVNGLHNLVHILSGILALIFAFQPEASARKFALWFGIVYAVVAVLGFIAPSFMSNLLMVNMSDNVLHVLLAIVLIALGSMKSSSAMSSQSM